MGKRAASSSEDRAPGIALGAVGNVGRLGLALGDVGNVGRLASWACHAAWLRQRSVTCKGQGQY
jgi:hypothetical protein